MSNISDWLNDEVYPSIFERADQVFTEHKFNRDRNGWRSKTYLNGSPHKDRPDKTVISSKAPYCILEQGGEAKSIYDYIKDRDGLTDKETLEALSKLSGVPLPRADYTQAGDYLVKRTRAQILEDAQAYFIYCLGTSSNAKEVREYLQTDRGYLEADIEAMGLGYIPSQDKLRKYLTETKSHKIEDVNKALTLNKAIGETHVLTIPFREPSGQIRGFIVRTVKPGVEPKYYYSTGLKREDILFNLKAVKGDKDLTIVEGLLDALSSEAKGLNNIVALGGSSLNKTQIEEAIKRGAKRLTLCLDNDKAGEEATLKALDLISKETDLPTFVATLPDGIKDPDQLVRDKGAEALQEALSKAVRDYEYKLQHILNKYVYMEEDKGETSPKDLEDFLEEVTITAYEIKSPVDRDLFINHFLGRIEGFKISKESLQATVDRLQYKEDREAQRREFNKLLGDVTGLSQKGEVNKALRLLSKQSKQLIQKDRESEYSRLLLPLKEDEVKQRQAGKPESIRAGYKIGGEELLLPAGAISIITAPTSHGKTTALINLILNTAQEYPDKRFYLFSYEEDGDSIFINVLNTYIAEDLSKNNRRSIRSYYSQGTDEYFTDPPAFHTGRNRFFKELIDSQRLNINYTDYSSETLIEAIRYLHKHSNMGGVFIDYMQLLSKAEGRYNTRQEELKQVCLDLKDLAVETGLPIVLGAQFNREVTNPLLLHPTKIGEAGDIERLANLIVGLWNNNFEPLGATQGELNEMDKRGIRQPNTIYTKVLKNRGGIAGLDEVLTFEGNKGKISNKQETGF